MKEKRPTMTWHIFKGTTWNHKCWVLGFVLFGYGLGITFGRDQDEAEAFAESWNGKPNFIDKTGMFFSRN